MTEKRTPVRVVFRADKFGEHKGEVTAVFDLVDNLPYLSVYSHIGQHGTARYPWYVEETRSATPEEYLPLLAELGRIGYDVTVGKRLTN